MSDQEQSPNGAGVEAPQPTEHLNIKVTDGNNEVFFKIKRSTQLKKLMDAFCDRQGKDKKTVRFLFDGTRVNEVDSPDTVSTSCYVANSFSDQDSQMLWLVNQTLTQTTLQLDMADGDTLEVHQEQIGGW